MIQNPDDEIGVEPIRVIQVSIGFEKFPGVSAQKFPDE
jgi:hypothetical protein